MLDPTENDDTYDDDDDDWEGPTLAEALKAARRDVLFEGQFATFRRVDASALDETLLSSTAESQSERLTKLGFHRVGDLVADAAPDVLLRGYAKTDENLYAMLKCSDMGEVVDLLTTFSDGTTLTTTDDELATDSDEEGGAVKHCLPGARVIELVDAHRTAVSDLLDDLTTNPVEAELRALAKTLDLILSREN